MANAGHFVRAMHRVHRKVGSIMAGLLALWFASGAVMAFASYPYFSEPERLRVAPALPAGHALRVPESLRRHLVEHGLGEGRRVRLALIEARPTWLYDTDRARLAVHDDESPLAPLDATRAAAVAVERLGMSPAEVQLLERGDQWTVAIANARNLPLFHLGFSDTTGTEAYVSARTGEIVQLTTQGERLWAWLGAIPHWIYPTILRRERELWRDVVLVLSAVGLLVSISGSIAGVHTWLRTRGRRGIRDRVLRWHQRLGLLFGLFATTWLLSGALSLSPFHWSDTGAPRERERAALHGGSFAGLEQVPAALAACQHTLRVVELELAQFGGQSYAVCSDADAHSLIVALQETPLSARPRLTDGALRTLAQRLTTTARSADHELAHAYDAYHYPTHARPYAALPYARLSLHDEAATVYYIDTQRARVMRRYDTRTRLERWLYQGLHSLDWPALYTHRLVWRSLIVLSMLLGFTLSALGLAMAIRRTRRAQSKRARR